MRSRSEGASLVCTFWHWTAGVLDARCVGSQTRRYTIASLLLGISFWACSGDKARKQQQGVRANTAVLKSTSVLGASEAIAQVEFRTCSDLQSVLGALQELSGLIELNSPSLQALARESVEAARAACSASELRALLPTMQGALPRLIASWVAADEDTALAALSETKTQGSGLLLRRRGELLLARKRPEQALKSLLAALALEEEPALRGQAAHVALLVGQAQRALELCAGHNHEACQDLKITALAKLGNRRRLIAQFRLLPLHRKAEVADRVLASMQDSDELLQGDDTPAPFLVAAAKLCTSDELHKKVALLERALVVMSEDAELWAQLAESREQLGEFQAAVAAWDQAFAVSLGNTRAQLSAIRILAENGWREQALARSQQLAQQASDGDSLHTASLAYKYAGGTKRAVELAAGAAKARPHDGRYRTELASRMVEAGREPEAIFVLRKLLVCGVSGHSWHRHEIAAQLAELRSLAATIGKDGEYGCPAVDGEELREILASQPQR